MAVEAKRGCGYRKVGGTYLVSDTLSASCDRLPFPLTVCPCCGEGIKQARAWTWIDPIKLFGTHVGCKDDWYCPMCNPGHYFTMFDVNENGAPRFLSNAKAGLIWVGEKFYNPNEFLSEASMLGVSRRVSCLPRGFKLGETWVFLAHSKACHRWDTQKVNGDGQLGELEEYPGVFCVFKPQRIERIVDQSEYDTWQEVSKIVSDEMDCYDSAKVDIWEKLQRAVDRGMTLVPVPDKDPDHH